MAKAKQKSLPKDAGTGKIVTRKYANSNKKTTYNHTLKKVKRNKK